MPDNYDVDDILREIPNICFNDRLFSKLKKLLILLCKIDFGYNYHFIYYKI